MKALLAKTTIVALLMLPVAGVQARGPMNFNADLSGAQEVADPPVDTPASGRITIRFDKALSDVALILRVKNLLGNLVGAHFHCARPGGNGPVAFGLMNPGPLTFDGREIAGTLSNANYTGADCVPSIGRPVNNIAALAFAMRDGLIYINVHTDAFPGGELRGQITD